MDSQSELPTKIEKIYEGIDKDVTWLHGKWKIYRQLYGTSQENIDLLNYSASTVFRVLQRVLYNDILLSLSRLTDPKTSFNKENRSLELLISRIDSSKHENLVSSMKVMLKVLRDQCEPFRIQRNKKIAHTDLDTALKVRSIPGVSRKQIGDALSTLSDLMNEYNNYFFGKPTLYEHFWMKADGDTLIQILQNYRDRMDEEDRIQINEFMEYSKEKETNDKNIDNK